MTTADEQAFLAEYLFKKHQNSVHNDIWLGAKYEGGRDFRWRTDFGRGIELLDGSDNYYNWAPGRPKVVENNLTGNNNKSLCIEMNASGNEKSRGQWREQVCTKNNMAVCERPQVWSAYKLQVELANLHKLNEITQVSAMGNKQVLLFFKTNPLTF